MKVATALIASALLLAAGIMPALAAEEPDSDRQMPPTIAIIIDDMGHNRSQGERLIALDQPLTLAFLPFRRYTTTLAEKAHKRQKEIMLHAPMANTRNFGLGPGGLTPDMDEQSLTRPIPGPLPRTQSLVNCSI